MNLVLNAMSTGTARTWNGAISNPTTGHGHYSNCLDYFAKCGTFRHRDQSLVNMDMGSIFADDQEAALRIVFGLRLITRTPAKNGAKLTEESQTGFGCRDEFLKACVWLVENRPDVFYKNLHLIPLFGSWKDFIQEPLVDVIDHNCVYKLIQNNLDDNLLRKYLPQIRSSGRIRSERDRKRSNWAKGLCRYLGISHQEYRKLKSSGTAHIWQKQMAAGEWDKIHFNGIPGKAMTKHISLQGKDKQGVFERHGQIERLREWLKSQKVVKFTGYPYELSQKASKKSGTLQRMIYDAQFNTVLESMKGHQLGNVLCAVDTSGSMACRVVGTTTALDICLSMGISFSMMNTGFFKDHVVAFDNVSKLYKLKGGFCDRVAQLRSMTTAWGSTDFQSVIDLLVNIRKSQPSIPLNEYPDTILVISDMQFNPAGGNTETNYQTAVKKLKAVGLGEIRIIWWYVNGAGSDFPSKMDDKGVYMIGGFDPVNIKALMGLNSTQTKEAPPKQQQTPLDGMMNFISQPIFDLIQS